MTLSTLDSFKLIFFIVVCLSTIGHVASQDEEEASARSRSCRTTSNKPGVCIGLAQCAPIMNIVSQNPFRAYREVRRSLCARSLLQPMVCCPENENEESNSGSSSSNNNSNNEEENSNKPSKVQLLQPPECGRSNKPHNRVVGGAPAELGAWPWIANLGYFPNDPNQLVFICGASLISSRHVITAGHCVYRTKKFFVRLGEHNLNSDDDGANPIDIRVEKVTIHPQYDHEVLLNDIAILKLAKEVEFTDAIHPICLPVEDEIKNRNLVNNFPFVAGWGKTSTKGAASDVLRETQVPVVDEETCKKDYRSVRNVAINKNVICAGYARGGKDACQGDSGGPLMFPLKQNYYLIGVVSGGYKCAEPDFPGLYTRVSSFLDFIQSNMN